MTSSCEHGKTVTLVPASTNATPVVPFLSGNSQNSLPMLLQLLSQASSNTPPVTAVTNRNPLVSVNTPEMPKLSFNSTH